MSALTAKAAGGDLIKIEQYDVDMTVQSNREILVTERIDVTFLQGGLTMFYRSLPTDGASYKNIQASCAGNSGFRFDVIDNPDMGGFIDVECIGGVEKGITWSYLINYVMKPTEAETDKMIIDVIGYGWSVPLHNVHAVLRFPAPATINGAYQGAFGTGQQTEYHLSADRKTLSFEREILEMTYTEVYDEKMAEGVTIDFTLPKGTLDGYLTTRIFTEDMWKLMLGALVVIVAAIAVVVMKTRRDIVTTVHIKPPRGMDPLLMGKILDGTVDTEDVTSMIYYFAHKGYLNINFENEDDPELIRRVEFLPTNASVYEKTLFKGLFEDGQIKTTADGMNSVCSVTCSQLVTKFYASAEKAKKQIYTPKPMYDKKSVFGLWLGGILGFLFAFMGGLLMGRKIGGGYTYVATFFAIIPIAVNLCIGYVRENYRYKWKSGKRTAMLLVEVGVSLLCGVLFTALFAHHIMTGWERLVLCIGGIVPSLITQYALSRSEKYVQTLGDVMGFKQFIVATEEDKIKFMLQENPELYYEILPYAQVLGVTDEWEKKFESIMLEPPTWCAGHRMTTFDYMMINRSMRLSMLRGMAEAARKSSGGGHIGFGGGGGSFGGFGGGGFGGGGGGAR